MKKRKIQKTPKKKTIKAKKIYESKNSRKINSITTSQKKEQQTSVKNYIIWLLGCIIFIFFTPRQIAYSRIGNWVLVSMIVFVLPYLIYKIMKSFYGEGLRTTLGFIFIPMILALASAFLNDYRKEKALSENGQFTECFVISREQEIDDHRYYYIQCEYFVDGRRYTTSSHDEEYIEYKIGDTLKLKYNKEFPKMYEIYLE